MTRLTAATGGDRPRGSLARRTFAGILALCTAFIAALTVVGWRQGHVTALEQARSGMDWELRLTASHIERDLAGLAASVGRLAANPFFANLLLDDGSGARLQAGSLLADARIVGLARVPIAVTDHRGRTLAATGGSQPEPFAEQARRAVESGRANASMGGSPRRLSLAVPVVIASTGQAEGALVAQVLVEELLPEQPAAGTTVSLEPPRAEAGALVRSLPLALPAPLDGLGLHLHARTPLALALAPARTSQGQVLIAAGIAELLAVLLCWGLAQRLTGPVRGLAAAVERIGATGDLRAPLPEARRDDETGLLAAAMQEMLAELGQGRDRLEALVAERTAALAASEARARRLAMVAERTDNAVVVTGPDGRVEWCNPAFTRITGWPLDDIRGRTPGSFLQGPRTDPATVAAIRAALTARTGISTEILNRTRDGREFWFQVEIQPMLGPDGTLEGFLSIESDVTARRELLAELRQAKEAAEAASQAKSAFLANMSHEIRTPMNGVLGLAELLLAADGMPPECREMVGALHRSGETLLVILNDILDFSKVEAGRLELERIPFDLAVLTGDIAALFRTRVERGGVALEVVQDLRAPARLLGDPGRLRQVLANLVGNAAKFTAAGRITVRLATAPAEDGRVAVALAVEDTGPGIPADRLGQLFQPFTQADASTARRYGGTGLGLAICRRLVGLMGGTITVDSVPGRGTAFRCALTLDAQADGPAEPATGTPAPSAAPLPPFRALLAEDNPINRFVATGMITRLGGTLVEAGDGRAAVEAWERGGFDVILMDWQMPDLDGCAATAEIRAAEARLGRPRIPIIAMTANAMSEDRAACLAAGMDDHLPKPLSMEALRTVLGTWLRASGDRTA